MVNLRHDSNGKEGKMAADATDVRREAHTKIRARIVAALEKSFRLERAPGLQIGFGDRTDMWMSLPPDFAKEALSDESIVAALEKELGLEFERGAYVRFGEGQQGSDVWLPLPPDFLQGELSEAERQAVAGWSIMIHWDVVPGKVLREAEPGALLVLGCGIYPARFWEGRHSDAIAQPSLRDHPPV
jgi:hypothetical protein